MISWCDSHLSTLPSLVPRFFFYRLPFDSPSNSVTTVRHPCNEPCSGSWWSRFCSRPPGAFQTLHLLTYFRSLIYSPLLESFLWARTALALALSLSAVPRVKVRPPTLWPCKPDLWLSGILRDSSLCSNTCCAQPLTSCHESTSSAELPLKLGLCVKCER